MRAPYQIADGRAVVTTPGTAVPLSTSAIEITAVTVCAEIDNTGYVTVGGATVVNSLTTRRGIPLAAGDTQTFSTNLLGNVWIDAQTAGDGVTFNIEGRS